jgi:pimeloyl-ACP methyl ester carboxylesterase
MRKPWLLFVLGLVLVLGGSALAWKVQTVGGIKVTEVTFPGTGGASMSGLLYTPPNATAATPAPGVLAVHGYINSRETQSGFAIEFARRGYVVLALDQTGHGYSDGPAFSNGFGGPDGLAYLRSLKTVDPANIGLEGHSMGGWTVLAAAAAMPDAYKAVVLEGSSTGKPFAAEGSPTWPRNLALVFSRYDEFSKLMWGVDRAQDVASSKKLQAVFGTAAPVQVGHVHGSVADGTARLLRAPNTTHPGDHLSPVAIGHALDWFALTLDGGTPRPAGDQIWMWKEAGTAIALLGSVVLLLGTFELLLSLPLFAPLRQLATPTPAPRDRGWWGALALTALLPVVTYFPFFILGMVALPANPILKQAVTNQVLVWAVLNALITLSLGAIGKREKPVFTNRWRLSVMIGLLSIVVVYAALELAHRLFLVDFRFWVVALKRLSSAQADLTVVYLLPLTLAFEASAAIWRRACSKYSGRLSARDQVAVVDHHGRHRADARRLPGARRRGPLGRIGPRSAPAARRAPSRPAFMAAATSTSWSAGLVVGEIGVEQGALQRRLAADNPAQCSRRWASKVL